MQYVCVFVSKLVIVIMEHPIVTDDGVVTQPYPVDASVTLGSATWTAFNISMKYVLYMCSVCVMNTVTTWGNFYIKNFMDFTILT